MVTIILADSTNQHKFKIPRQLLNVNGEPLIKRTIRLLKENGVKDIMITSHDKRFDNLGAIRYEPLYNVYDPIKNTGYWLNAFPIELLNQPVCFIWGDVYYSEEAIKKIVETETDSTLFFCTYENKDQSYIKTFDEPLAYKVIDYELFKKHIDIVKKMKDEGLCVREPIVWELYRSINGQDINIHKMTKNYIAINDISCDIDCMKDLILLEQKLGGVEMFKCEVIESFTLSRFNELTNIVRKGTDVKGLLNVGDTFECGKDLADYLLGENKLNKACVRLIEIIPAKEPEPKHAIKVEISKRAIKKPTTKKKSTK